MRATTTRVAISLPLKLSLLMICVLPIALATWVVFAQKSLSLWVASVILASVTLVFVLVGVRLYSLLSIELDNDGVRQSFVFGPRGFLSETRIGWQEIAGAVFRGHSFLLNTPDRKVEINTSLFPSAEAVVLFVREHLSAEIRATLDDKSVSSSSE
jgi:hypothetical protein